MKYKLTAIFAGLTMTIIPCLAQEGPGPGRPALDLSKLPPPSDRTGLTFTNDIEPIFKASCANCHSGPRARANLRLNTLENALKGGLGRNGEKVTVITPGDSAHSPLVVAVARLDPRTAMPPPPRRGRPGGPGGPGGQQPGMGGPGAPGGGPDAGTNAPPAPDGGAGPGPGMPPPPGGDGRRGPPTQPLTPEQVGLIRAWIDQGAK